MEDKNIHIPECKMESRQEILQSERLAMDCGGTSDALHTQLLLDIRDLLKELVDSHKKRKQSIKENFNKEVFD